MKMIRFKEDVPDENGLVWQKGNIYKVLYEDDEHIMLESDAINDDTYSIPKSDLNVYCFVYVCNNRINENCKYCKYLNEYSQRKFCGNVERGNPDGQGLLQRASSDYIEAI